MTLAHLTPLPPDRTGVADATASLLTAVSDKTTCVAYAKGQPAAIPGVTVRRASRLNLRRARRFPAVVAQMGNSAAHAWILNELRRRPAIVELHDVVLHHLVAHMYFAHDGEEYVAAMQRESGFAGATFARASLAGKIPRLWEIAAERFPLTGEALRHATSVIVHSQFAAKKIRERWPHLPVDVVPLLPPEVHTTEPERIPDTRGPVVGCFGFITPEKRLPSVMAAVARVRREHPDTHLLIVGAAQTGISLRQMASEAGLGETAVTVVDYAPAERFAALMSGVDIGINLRWPTMGETSATAVQMLTVGIPLLVSDGGWYDEIPDDAALRIPADETEVSALVEGICALADSPTRRVDMSEAGRTWRRETLAPARIADLHLMATLGRAGSSPLSENLTTQLGRSMAEVSNADTRRTSGLATKVATAGRELGIL